MRSPRARKLAIRLAVLLAAGGLPAAGYLLFTGPRMKVQPHIRAFQAVMPTMPSGVLPVQSPLPDVPTTQQARTMKNPLEPTAANLLAGKTFYTYYCVSCHGANGDGYGPVGESYFPRSADLRSARVRSYADGQLLRAMLTGIGHENVLNRVMPEEARWPVVLHVRRLETNP